MSRRLAIIHADANTRERLDALVRGAPGLSVVGVSGDASEGRRMVAETDPDLVIVGLRLAGADGVHLSRLLIADAHRRRVVVLADVAYSLFAQRALEAGAFGYILASSTDDALLDGLNTVLDGGMCVAPRVARFMQPDTLPKTALTDAERRIVDALRDGAPTTAAVAEELDVALQDVARIERRLIQRLGVYSRAGVRLYAHRSIASASASDMDNASA